MNIRQNFTRWVVIPSLALILLGAALAPRPAQASMEDAALFYDELSQHGEWVDYENHGPVWYPTKVQENWRPYVDGRWTPAEDGQVFETQEPWGWATYHYGNWMPTEEYGWVWVPGRTWYPNTVTWRTSPESESPEASYIGWAPIPPPNYTPSQGYYPEGYHGGGSYGGPMENLITAPFWIFVKAANFLLGFSQPYAPSYSYWGCNCLMPPPMSPYYARRTVIVHNYYSPSYYPVGYIGAGRGYYNWGPPIPYVARVTRINQTTINNYVRNVNIYQRANVVPPPAVMARRAHFREVVPPAMVRQQPLPRAVHVRDVQMARGHLARPNLVDAKFIKNAPPITASLPKTRVAPGESGQWRRGVPGSALPASAMMRPDRKMEKTLANIPSSQRLEPVSPRARKWQTPPTAGAGAVQPEAMPKPGGPELSPDRAKIHSPTPPKGTTPGMGPGPQGKPQAVTPGGPGAPPETAVRSPKAATPEVLRPRHPGSSQAGVKPEKSKPGAPPPGSWGRPEQTPQPGVTSMQTPGKGQKQRYPSGTPSGAPGAPAQVQPQPQPQPRSPLAQPPMQQPRQSQPQKKKYSPDQSQGAGPGGPGMTGPPSQSRYAPPSTQPQAQPQPRSEPQPRIQPRPQMQQAPPQVQRQVQAPPRPQPQVQQQPQPRPQAQPQAQAPQQQQKGKHKQTQQNQ